MILILQYVAAVWVIQNYLTIIFSSFNWTGTICLKCLTFWLVLIYTFDPFTAAISSLLSYLLDKYLIKTDTPL